MTIWILLLLSASAVEFEKKWLKLGEKRLLVEVADTHEKRQKGLMHRKVLPEGTGMIFIFPKTQVLSFWMKNTFVPLSIGYFDESQKLIDIQQMAPAKSIMQQQFKSYHSKKPAKYALEVPQGWFKKNKVGLGVRFELENNKLPY